jgi:hypothetical protein
VGELIAKDQYQGIWGHGVDTSRHRTRMALNSARGLTNATMRN